MLASVLFHLVKQPRPTRNDPHPHLSLQSPNLGVPPPFLHFEISFILPFPRPPPGLRDSLLSATRLCHTATHTTTALAGAGGVFAFPAPTKLSSPAGPRTASHAEPKFRLIGWALIRGPLRPPLTPNDIDPLHLLLRRPAPGAPAVTLCATGENK